MKAKKPYKTPLWGIGLYLLILASMSQGMELKKVAIIGGGPAGLVSAKEFKALGHDVTLFESSAQIGGQWNSNNKRSAVWNSLNMNTPRHMIEFSDFSWDDVVPPTSGYSGTFPPHRESQQYLLAYVKNFGLEDHIKTNHEIVAVKKNADASWEVEFEINSQEGESIANSQTFDMVIFATGMFTKANRPLDQKGGPLEEYRGKIIHSHDFKTIDMADVKDQTVMVIGNGISGTEIATEMVRAGAKEVIHSIRKPHYHINTYRQDRPTETLEETFFQRFPVILGRYLPQSLNSEGLKKAVLEAFPLQLDADILGSEWVLDGNVDKAGVALSRHNYVEDVHQGKVLLQKIPVGATADELIFPGNERKQFDLVIMATGYSLDIPFLSDEVKKDIVVKGRNDLVLYNHVLHPSEATLAFVGFKDFVGAVWPAVEMEARYAARALSGMVNLPSQDKIQQEMVKIRASKKLAGAHIVASHVQEDLGDLLGITPSLLQCLVNPSKYLFACLYPCSYRTSAALDDASTVTEAAEKWEKYRALK